MYHDLFVIIIILIAIIAVSHLFCNAIEHFGAILKFTEAVSGSIFSAIATALPETIIPILSLFNTNNTNINLQKNIVNEISLGAILGAPLMLSTLSLFIMSISAIKQRGFWGNIKPDFVSLTRDLHFFLFSYFMAFLALFTKMFSWKNILNITIALILGFTYLLYLVLATRNSKLSTSYSEITKASEPLFLKKLGLCNKNNLNFNLTLTLLQLIVALILLIIFANLFVVNLQTIAIHYNMSAFLLALIVVPIVTELPEKINSIIWLAKNKDTLAISNITGAMVFQGSLLPIIGILFTDWSINNKLSIVAMVVTVTSTLWLYYNVKRKQLPICIFLVNGILYIFYIYVCHLSVL